MTGIVGGSDQFVETIKVADEVLHRGEGTLPELATSVPLMSAAPAPQAKTKVEDVIKVLTFVWDIVKDTKAQAATDGAHTRILSAQDDNWVGYENAVNFQSDPVEFFLNNIFGVNCYTVRFRVAGTYQARHHSLGGSWMPLVHVAFSQCDANLPWVVNGTARIVKDAISNMGTRDNPIPQIVLGVKISTRATSALTLESHERTFLFNVNGKSGATLVSAH